MGCLFRLCGLFFVAILIGWLITNLMNAVQNSPAVKKIRTVSLQDFKNAQRLVSRYNLHLMSPNHLMEFHTTTHEINKFLKVSEKLIPNIATQVQTARGGILIKMSVSLPSNPLGSYLNIRAIIDSSSQGLIFHQFLVGQVKIPQKLIKPGLHYALDKITGQIITKNILNSIRSVRVIGPKIYIRFWPSAHLAKDIKPGSTSGIDYKGKAIGIQR